LALIVKNKLNKNIKTGLDKIKKFSSFKRIAIESLNTIAKKFTFSTLSENFNTFVNKGIRNSSSKTLNKSQIISKSKSQ